MRFRAFDLSLPVMVGVSLLLIGCGAKGPAIVEGTVSIKGTKLNHGTLKLTSADGKSKTSPISPTGNYQITDAPTGEVTATVEVDKAQLAAMTTAKREVISPETKKFTLPPAGGEGPPVPIDAKYSQPANGSKISISDGGRQTKDIDFP